MEELFSLVVLAAPFVIFGVMLAVVVTAIRMKAPTRDKIVYAASGVGALGLGLLWGFFVAFNVVFSDIFGLGEQLGALAYVLVAYLALGTGFGVASGAPSRRWMWWLVTPGVVVVSAVVLSELGSSTAFAVYALGVIASIIVGVLAGLAAGRALRRWWSSRKSVKEAD